MNPTLYEQLGAENLQQMVNNFYDLVVEDKEISHLFTTDMEIVKRKQTTFLTQFLGGPMLYNQEYGHPRMRMRHMPHKITGEGAMAWLNCMNQAIEALDIEEDLKTNLFNCFPKLAAHMINSHR
ncbi:MAG: hemoglobin [Paraglaciecola sp.]|jgi:hemoglobin